MYFKLLYRKGLYMCSNVRKCVPRWRHFSCCVKTENDVKTCGNIMHLLDADTYSILEANSVQPQRSDYFLWNATNEICKASQAGRFKMASSKCRWVKINKTGNIFLWAVPGALCLRSWVPFFGLGSTVSLPFQFQTSFAQALGMTEFPCVHWQWPQSPQNRWAYGVIWGIILLLFGSFF